MADEVTPYDPTPELERPILGPEDSLPRISYKILQRGVTSGTITREDIRHVRSAGWFETVGIFAGSLTAIPIYDRIRRARPLLPRIVPFTFTLATMSISSFAGYTLGMAAGHYYLVRKIGNNKCAAFQHMREAQIAEEIDTRADLEKDFAARLRGDAAKAELRPKDQTRPS